MMRSIADTSTTGAWVLLALAVFAAAWLLAWPAAADQVVNDDLIVADNLCVGAGCEVDQDFGFDTVQLKDDVLRLYFQDTSTSTGFPTTDWRIVINDDDAGSESYFAVEDSTAATRPLFIEAGSPSYSIYVSDEGRVGIGTPQPEPGTLLDVAGNARIGGTLNVDGTLLVDPGVKAGIIPKSAFSKGKATVTFASPYAGDYTIQLTPVAANKDAKFSPAVLKREATGFRISGGKSKLKQLVEVHWVTRPVGEGE